MLSHDACFVTVYIPAAAGIPKYSSPWVNSPSLQLLHLLQKGLPHSATYAARQKEADQTHEGPSKCYTLQTHVIHNMECA